MRTCALSQSLRADPGSSPRKASGPSRFHKLPSSQRWICPGSMPTSYPVISGPFGPLFHAGDPVRCKSEPVTCVGQVTVGLTVRVEQYLHPSLVHDLAQELGNPTLTGR